MTDKKIKTIKDVEEALDSVVSYDGQPMMKNDRERLLKIPNR